MIVSRKWLEAFLRQPLDSHDLTERLAMLGAPVDAVEQSHAAMADLVVGLVEAVEPHPDADKLSVCSVNDGGDELLQVICGAPNVTAGKRYPLARVGTTLPGGLTIEKRKIRGQVSRGMLCSARELEMGEDHTGILELVTEAAAGSSLLDALDLDDESLEVDVTPNRPDLLGHKGIARELAASYGRQFRLPTIPGGGMAIPAPIRADGAEGTTGGVRVAIEDPEGCPRFLGAVIRGVTIGPSPAWLRNRLEAVGIRSINNVVDATNYILIELGQPTHAYDLQTLRGSAIIARRAGDGEGLTTLDGKDRTASADMTLIADAEGAIGIGGVMGGETTEVRDTTTDIFLECASFQPSRIRRTRTDLGLSTDASFRFERGVDKWGAPDALRRCLEILLATAGGELDGSPVDVWPETTHPPRIFLRAERVRQVLGEDIPWAKLEEYLVAIGATVVSKPDDGRIAVDVPGWRPDLTEEIDLVEEVARMHGYDNFPSDLRPFRVGTLPDDPASVAVATVRDGLAAAGLNEVATMPMAGPDGEGCVAVLNPLSSQEGFLRRRLIPGLTRQVERNWALGVRDVRLFEVGTVFEAADPGQRPREEIRVAGVITGQWQPRHWSDGEMRDVNRWDVAGLFHRAVALAYPSATVQVDGESWVAVSPEGQETIGRTHRLDADAPPWAAPVYGFEVRVHPGTREIRRYQALPETPASTRDVSLLIPPGVTAAQVDRAMRVVKGTRLESLEVLSEFHGGDLPAGHRTVAFRLTFRDPQRTLRDKDVEKAFGRILAAVEREVGVAPRGAGEAPGEG
jgi:phenylalanyl-tRNA synthetase beta chain